MKAKRRSITAILAFTSLLVLPDVPAFAMHISEGILPAQWAILWFAASVPFLFLGLRELHLRGRGNLHLKPMVGLVGAAVFIISCMPIPVPTAGSCSHPCGTGIAAIFIGPMLTVVVASVALLLQALFLAHGGLTTLGVILPHGGRRRLGRLRLIYFGQTAVGQMVDSGFHCRHSSDWATYTVTSFQLATALHGDAPLVNFF